jgi:hypothetical protein
MVITFILWVLVNIVDIVISMVAIRLGAGEVGFLAGVGSFTGVVIVKLILVLIVGAVLFHQKRENILAALSLGLSIICIYNGCVLIKALEVISKVF